MVHVPHLPRSVRPEWSQPTLSYHLLFTRQQQYSASLWSFFRLVDNQRAFIHIIRPLDVRLVLGQYHILCAVIPHCSICMLCKTRSGNSWNIYQDICIFNIWDTSHNQNKTLCHWQITFLNQFLKCRPTEFKSYGCSFFIDTLLIQHNKYCLFNKT